MKDFEEAKRSKRSLVRETVQLVVREDEIEALIREAIFNNPKYKHFIVQEIVWDCGMGQGEGYFEQVRVKLLSEREEHK